MSKRLDLILILVASTIMACQMKKGRSFVPAIPGYSEKESSVVILDKSLREISGIDYTGNGQLLAINDEEGRLFTIDATTGKEQSVKFGNKADYEDVVKAGDHIYVLESNGDIHQLNASGSEREQIFKNTVAQGQEFETLYYDAAVHSLIMICKTCGESRPTADAYRFDLATDQFVPGAYFTITWSDIRKSGKDNVNQCRPSAAAFNPVLDKLFIVASLGRLLLQCSHDGKLEKVYHLNPDHFPQPEGLTFDPQGNMYISNEAHGGKATLWKFTYHRADR